MLDVQSHASNQSNINSNVSRRRQRFQKLSQPKTDKKMWMTSFGPKLFWGYEDSMWPVTKSALRFEATDRLLQLAVAKKNFQSGTRLENRHQFVYSCGRQSQIWKIKRSPVANETIQRLATPKLPPSTYLENRIHHPFGCGRVSPLWPVKPGALSCRNRPRTSVLAKPKLPHKDYQPNQEVETEINPFALKRVPSARLEELSRPKSRPEGPFIDSRWPNDSVSKVSRPAKSANASSRTIQLAKFKTNPDGYVSNREVQWQIPRSAKKAIATPRNEELAKPKIRDTMDHLQFNPEAFLVKPTALKAMCSPRIEELAHPIKR